MTVTIASLTLGPLGNNVYILGDEESGAAVVIDPSFEPRRQADEIRRRGWTLRQIWLTHGHFDHTEGAAALRELFLRRRWWACILTRRIGCELMESDSVLAFDPRRFHQWMSRSTRGSA